MKNLVAKISSAPSQNAEKSTFNKCDTASEQLRTTIIKPLLSWYATNGRHDLPWRKTRDPYKILVSELMLQQTQVSRVIPKYEAFVARFPTMQALSQADRSDVLRMWQGLGYNSRAARLHALANIITHERGGVLPNNYDALRALPGIGPYTAGAVIIFSHDLPAPCVDVNIKRVISRIYFDPSAEVTDAVVQEQALRLIEVSGAPHDWNSALMDFGSAICTARAPRCDHCPLGSVCKNQGARPDERLYLAKLQKPEKFHGSKRWWRGQILKQLLQTNKKSSMSRLNILFSILPHPSADEQRIFDDALLSMKEEELIVFARRRGKTRNSKDDFVCIK